MLYAAGHLPLDVLYEPPTVFRCFVPRDLPRWRRRRRRRRRRQRRRRARQLPQRRRGRQQLRDASASYTSRCSCRAARRIHKLNSRGAAAGTATSLRERDTDGGTPR